MRAHNADCQRSLRVLPCREGRLSAGNVRWPAPLSTLTARLSCTTIPGLNFSLGKYRYEIKTSANGSMYILIDGNRIWSADLLWAFGTGDVGQSYLFKQEDGNLYEARVTYFGTLNNLDFTPGP